MDERELLKERFKSAISSAVKAISENFDIEIKFDNNSTSKKNSLNLHGKCINEGFIFIQIQLEELFHLFHILMKILIIL